MIYLRVKPLVQAQAGEPLRLGDVAETLSDAKLNLSELRVSVPMGAGDWQIDALPLIMQIQAKLPDEVVNIVGDGTGWLRRVPKRSLLFNGSHGVIAARAVAASFGVFLLLALMATWLGVSASGVSARKVGEAVSANSPTVAPVALPFIIGAGLGVLLYCALTRRKKTASQLSSMLRVYRENGVKPGARGAMHQKKG